MGQYRIQSGGYSTKCNRGKQVFFTCLTDNILINLWDILCCTTRIDTTSNVRGSSFSSYLFRRCSTNSQSCSLNSRRSSTTTYYRTHSTKWKRSCNRRKRLTQSFCTITKSASNRITTLFFLKDILKGFVLRGVFLLDLFLSLSSFFHLLPVIVICPYCFTHHSGEDITKQRT